MKSGPVSYTGARVGVFDSAATQRIICGVGRLRDAAREAEERGLSRVFVISSQSVARKTPLLERLKGILGDRFIGCYSQISAHSPLDRVVEAARAAIEVDADGLISLGGGSVVDATKVVSFAIASNLASPVDIRKVLGAPIQSGDWLDRLPCHIAIPTTASAAEFTGFAGVLDPAARAKLPLIHPRLAPRIVIHDPEVSLHTPMQLWLSTAIRSLDHAIEAAYGPTRNAYTDALALEATRQFFAALPVCLKAPMALEPRTEVYSAVWLAGTAALGAGTSLSHGIGYLLGAEFGVPHGVCSCISLAAVMAWNVEHAQAQLARVARTIRPIHDFATETEAARLAPTLVSDLVVALDLPNRLGDLGTVSRADLLKIAEAAMDLPHAKSNPRRPRSKFEILKLLESMY